MTRSNPTLPQRLLMAILADERKRAGLNMVDAAEKAGVDHATISRYETGKRRPHPVVVKTLMKVYGESDDVAAAMAEMAVAAATAGWWYKHRKGMPAWLSTFLGLESSASMMRIYEVQVVPGIAQTEDYHRAILEASARTIAPEEVERTIELRQDRQVVLKGETSPELKIIIDQAALERPVGGPKVMASQLIRLAELAASPRNRVQVLPTKSGAHAGLAGPFVIFDFPTSEHFTHLKLPPVVYSEGHRGALYLEEPEDLQAHERVFEALTASAASPEESLEILHKMASAMAE